MKEGTPIAQARLSWAFWMLKWRWIAAILCVGSAMAEQEVRHPYRGITTISRKESLPRSVHMHVALIDLQAPGIRFKLSSPGGSRETVRQRTVDYLAAEQAQLAINAHFFLPYPSVDADAFVTGLAVSEGTLYSNTFSWYEVPRARTAIGVTTDNRSLVLFTVAEAGGSLGLSVSEVADFLIRDYQVRDALNLDGGGSTSMVLADPFTLRGHLLNASSDSPLGRAVGSNLAVFARQRSGQLDLHCVGSGPSVRFVFSWPSDGESWQLEWSSHNHPNEWTPVTQRPKIQNGRHTVIQPAYSPGRYYRLSAVR